MKKVLSITWDALLTSSLEELVNFKLLLKAGLSGASIVNRKFILESIDLKKYKLYCEILIYYCKFDIEGLNHILSYIRKSKDPNIIQLKLITEMRLIHRKGSIEFSEILEFENVLTNALVAFDLPCWLKAELCFVLGNLFYDKSVYKKAQDCFLKATVFYNESKCFKCSVRSKLKYYASISCDKTNLKLTAEYLPLADKALEVEDWTTFAVCLINVSKEFQIMKAYSASLHFAKKAILNLEQKKLFFKELGLCYIQAADILFELNRTVEAGNYIEKSIWIENEYVNSALKLLGKKYTLDYLFNDELGPLPSWSERKLSHQKNDQQEKIAKLGNMEEKLVNLLSIGEKSKHELIESIFPWHINAISKEERFKNLVSRVRKKVPNTLIFHNEKYQLLGN